MADLPVPPTAFPSNDSTPEGGGLAYVENLPRDPSPERESLIYAAVSAGFTRSVSWVPITATAGTHTLVFYVMSDSLCLGTDEDFVRISTTHATAQRIADTWGGADRPGAYLCTSKIADLIASNAVVLEPPVLLGGTPKKQAVMDKIETVLLYHRKVEENRKGREGLFCDAGKYWVNTPKLGTPKHPTRAKEGHGPAAANYGFFALTPKKLLAPKGSTGVKAPQGWYHGPGRFAVWQNVVCQHDLRHVDYSQTVRLVSRFGVLDGADVWDIADIASDPELCALVSDEGRVLMRHPAIPLEV